MNILRTVVAVALAIATVAHGASIPGSTTVFGPIAPGDTLDTYATHFEQYGQGGYRTVATTSERDGIPTDRRKSGMLVYVHETATAYQLGTNLTSWTQWPTLPTAATTSVNTIADLVALSTASLATNHSVRVLGKATAGDWGPSRVARWSPGSALATNVAYVFSVTGGQWVFDDRATRIHDARWFGSFPNSVTGRGDAGAASANAALQLASDYIDTTGGGVLFVPPGDYRLDSNLYLSARLHLLGSTTAYSEAWETNALGLAGLTRFYTHGNSTHKRIIVRGSDASAYGPIRLNTTFGDGSKATNWFNGGSIQGITFDGLNVYRGAAITLDGVFGYKIDDVAFQNEQGRPIELWACNEVTISRVRGTSRYGILALYSADCTFDDIKLGGTYGPGLWLRSANKNLITPSMFFNSQAQPSAIRSAFSVDPSLDTITFTDTSSVNFIEDGQPLTFTVADGSSLPTPLTTNAIYYAVRLGGAVFKVNTQRTQGASGGALQGVGMDLTGTGSGTFAVGPGPVANILVDGSDGNQFIGVRGDQSAGNGIEFWSASHNTVSGSAFTESGLLASTTNWAGIALFGTSHNNRFAGVDVRNRSANSKAGVGVITDGNGTNNFFTVPITGVTNAVGGAGTGVIAPGTYDTTRQQETFQVGLELRRSPTWGAAALKADVSSGGTLSLQAQNGDDALQVYGQTANATASFFSASDNATQGTRIPLYRSRGTIASPTQLQSGDQIAEILAVPRGPSEWDFTPAGLSVWLGANSTTNNAPTWWEISTAADNSATRLARLVIYKDLGVKITPDGSGGAPDANAVLHIASTTKSILLPLISTGTETNMSNPTNGLLHFNTSTKKLRVYADGWQDASGESGVGGGDVSSVFGRTGAVTAQSGDYTSAQITGLSEQIRDDMGTALVGTNGVAITVDDSADKILVGISGISSTLITGLDEQVRDTIGTALAAGSNIVITPNDGADSITVGLATNVSLNQIDVTTLNATTLNMATVAAGALVGTNSLKVGATTITDLDQLQPVDTDLTAIAGVSGVGLLARTGSGTAAAVSITGGSSKITVTGGNGASGNPSIDADESAFTLNNIGGTLGSTKGGLGTNAVTTKSILIGNGSGPVKALVGTNVLVYYGADGSPMVLGLGANLSTDGTNLIAAGGGGGGGSITYNGTAVTNITSGPDIVGDVASGNLTLRRPAPGTLTDGATISTVASNGVYFYTTVQGARTLANPTALVAGRQLTWEITQGTNMATTLTLGSAFKGSLEVPIPSDRNLILSTNAGHIHLIEGVVLSDGASVLLKTWRSGIN